MKTTYPILIAATLMCPVYAQPTLPPVVVETRVYEELTKRYLIPAAVLSAHGYGEFYPGFPDGSESEVVLDRRVLVVRVK